MIYHESRTVAWGHWGITFMDPQPDPECNFGVVVAFLPFPVSTRGPIDGAFGSLMRNRYLEICDAWTRHGALPGGVELEKDRRAVRDARWIENGMSLEGVGR